MVNNNNYLGSQRDYFVTALLKSPTGCKAAGLLNWWSPVQPLKRPPRHEETFSHDVMRVQFFNSCTFRSEIRKETGEWRRILPSGGLWRLSWTRQLRRRLYLGNAGPMPYLKIPKCPEGSEPITYGPCCYQLERGLKQCSFVTALPHYP